MQRPQVRDTAMSAAFKAAAGSKTPREQLRELAAKAVKKHPNDDGAASRKLLADAEDAGLLLALFEPWHRPATMDYLSAAKKATGKETERGSDQLANAEKAGLPVSPRRSAFPNHKQAVKAEQDVRRKEALDVLLGFKIDGVPIMQANVGFALSWARRNQREARWVFLVAYGLPESSRIIDHRTAADLERFHKQAQAETTNGGVVKNA